METELSLSSVTVIDRLFSDIRAMHNGQTRVIPTGFHALDKIIGGVQPGDLIIVGGFPGAGTTSFMMGIIRNLIDRNLPDREAPPLLVSLTDARPERWMLQMLSIESGLSEDQLVDGVDAETLTESRRKIAAYPLAFSCNYAQDVSNLEEQIESITNRVEGDPRPGILFVDRIEDHYPSDPWGAGLLDRKERIAGTVSALNKLVSSSGWAVVASTRLVGESRVSREITKLPTLRDICDPEIIVHAADKVILLHRPEMYVTPDEAAKKDWMHRMRVRVARNLSGKPSVCSMRFLHDNMRLEEWR